MVHEMRRTDREISDPAEIASLLRRGRYCTFALVDDGEPYVVTLSYGYDEPARRFYFHVAPQGHKLDIIARKPRACGTVILDYGYVAGECEHPFESAVLRGRLRVVTDDEEKRHAIRTLVAHLEDDPEAYWTSRTWALDDRLRGFAALCFEIDSMTAKRGK